MKSPSSYVPWLVAGTCCLMVALPWLWPVLYGPKNDMVPNLFAWAFAAGLFVLLPLCRDRAEAAVVSGWLFAAVISSVIGLLQFFDLENGFEPWISVTRPGDVLANVHQVNLLATLLAVGLLSLWWMTCNRYLRPMLAGTIAFLLIVGLAATASRTGMVHAVLLSALMLGWGGTRRRSVMVVLLGLALYVTAALSLPWIQELSGVVSDRSLLGRFGNQSACSSRLLIWSNVVQLIFLKPISGWGWDGLVYAHYITAFDGARFCEKLSNAHNLPLQLAVSVGIPIALIIILLIGFIVFKQKPWRAKSPSEQFAWGVLTLLGFHSLVEYPLWFGVAQVMVILVIWMIWRARTASLLDTFGVLVVGISLKFRIIGAALMILIATYVAWDYYKVTQLFTPAAERHRNYQTDTLNKVKATWLFQSYLLYSIVTTTPVDNNNAGMMLGAALEVLEDFPDPAIIVKVIRSARLTGDTALEQLHTARFEAAWPKAFKSWEAAEKSSGGEPNGS